MIVSTLLRVKQDKMTGGTPLVTASMSRTVPDQLCVIKRLIIQRNADLNLTTRATITDLEYEILSHTEHTYQLRYRRENMRLKAVYVTGVRPCDIIKFI